MAFKLFRRNRTRSSADPELESSRRTDNNRTHRSSRHSTAASSSTEKASSSADPTATPAAKQEVTTQHDGAITYMWDRRFSQALELGRRTASPPLSKFIVHWRPGTETLGITLDVELTTRQIIVIQSTRRDIRAGAILVAIAGQTVHEETFHSRLAAMKRAAGVTTGITVALEFAPAPAPVVVKKRNFDLAMLGVDKDAFELVSVNGVRVRYLSLQDINWLIYHCDRSEHESNNNYIDNNNNVDRDETNVCEMVFERIQTNASGAGHKYNAMRPAATTGGAVTAMAAVAAISSALS